MPPIRGLLARQRVEDPGGGSWHHRRRDNGKVVDIPAGLSVFPRGSGRKLDFVRKYDIDVGTMTQWWSAWCRLR